MGLIVDLFAGGGGASLGIRWAMGRDPDVAVNHDPEAIAMHAANHPATRHLVNDVWMVPPLYATQGRLCGNSVCPPIAEALVRANCLQVQKEAA